MGCYTRWLAIAICFTAIAALQADAMPERPEEQFDDANEWMTPSLPPFAGTTDTTPYEPPFAESTSEIPPATQNVDDTENDDEDDVKKHAKWEEVPPARDFLETNPTMIGGQPVFQGDIALTESQWRAIKERKAIRSTFRYWPKNSAGIPIVPYAFGDTYVSRAAVLAGINHWQQNTCIRFVQTSITSQPHLRFIRSSGCWSYIGRQTSNGQYISIGNGCTSLVIVAHEIGHAIGFFHEQSRPDRDNYVKVLYENILSGMQHNFNMYSTTVINMYGIPYDYSSAMHYGPRAFSKNGLSTIITPNNPFALAIIGRASRLSHRDIHLANLMYGCIALWEKKCSMSTSSCQNGGFLGENCRCVCPPGTTGTYCQGQTGCYYDNSVTHCSRRITMPSTIVSEGFPVQSTRGVPCVLWIQAPRCYRVYVRFYWFQMYQRLSCYGTSCCRYDFMEIFTNPSSSGQMYCGREINWYQTFISSSNTMVLHYKTYFFYTGFYAYVGFIRQSNCT